MAQADLTAVAKIEQQQSSAWSVAAVEEELWRQDGIALVICSEMIVVGWGCCRYSEGEAELLKIAVTSSLRRCGLGSILMDNFLSILRRFKVNDLFLEVRSRNHPALLFYFQRGFTEVGRRINYYKEPADDALVLRREAYVSESEIFSLKHKG